MDPENQSEQNQGGNANANESGSDPKNQEVKFSEEQQKALDAILKKRLDEVNSKHAEEIKQLQAKHTSELEEREKTAKMKDDEKKAYENKKLLEELEALKKEKADNEHKAEISKLVEDKGVNSKFAKFFCGIADLKEASSEIDEFKKIFDAEVLAEVNKKIDGHTPKNNSSGSNNGVNPFVRKSGGLFPKR